MTRDYSHTVEPINPAFLRGESVSPILPTPRQSREIVIIVDGLKFTLDYSNASAQTLSDIMRIIKGLLKVLEQPKQ